MKRDEFVMNIWTFEESYTKYISEKFQNILMRYGCKHKYQ